LTIVAIIAPGSMGSAFGGRLVQAGAEVRTVLDGRSPASVERANAAGMRAVPAAAIAESDFVLSIVPPDKARAVAETFAPVLAAASHKPVYVDCNAVNPATLGEIAGIIAPTGTPFVDAAIIGGPPAEGKPGPVFYASGDHAPAFARLASHGLAVKTLEAPIGAASALKMSYAGITKGLVALAAAMSLAATRAGVAAALKAEMAASQAPLRARFQRSIPDMFGKARRWAPELDEIAGFVGGDHAESRIFGAIADFYERIADGVDKESAEMKAQLRFWNEELSE
jgi:putative dehydrogenase